MKVLIYLTWIFFNIITLSSAYARHLLICENLDPDASKNECLEIIREYNNESLTKDMILTQVSNEKKLAQELKTNKPQSVTIFYYLSESDSKKFYIGRYKFNIKNFEDKKKELEELQQSINKNSGRTLDRIFYDSNTLAISQNSERIKKYNEKLNNIDNEASKYPLIQLKKTIDISSDKSSLNDFLREMEMKEYKVLKIEFKQKTAENIGSEANMSDSSGSK